MSATGTTRRPLALALALALALGCSGQPDGGPRSPASPAPTSTAADGPRATPEDVTSPPSPTARPAGDGPVSFTEPAPMVVPPAPLPAMTVPTGALDRFYASLDRAERKDAAGRVLISMFGDSHTAGDQLTGYLRRHLGARFGKGGRGIVLAGRPPVRHYYLREVGYASRGTWKAELVGARGATPPFGLAGVRAHADRKTAEAWVETCAGCSTEDVDRFDVFYLRTRTSGRLAFRVDDGRWQKLPTRLATAAPRDEQAAVLSVPTRGGRHRLSLRPDGGGAVHLFAVAMERTGPGVVVDGLGVTGRRLGHLHGGDWDGVLGPQLAARAPSLVVLQFGTNEADDSKLDLALVARQYDDTIARLRTWAPDADILLVGPPDLQRRAAGKACDRRKPAAGAPLGVVEVVPPECAWRTPPSLPAIVELQRAAADRHQVAFYDTLAAFGGVDLMDAMLHLDPPLAFTDHVHLTQAGYERWARGLLDELLAGYHAWKGVAADVPTAPARVR